MDINLPMGKQLVNMEKRVQKYTEEWKHTYFSGGDTNF